MNTSRKRRCALKPNSALEAAGRIATSVTLRDGIDWGTEPLTERERAVRAKILEKRGLLGLWVLAPFDLRPASDLAEALSSAKRREDELRRADQRKEIQQAMESLDHPEPSAELEGTPDRETIAGALSNVEDTLDELLEHLGLTGLRERFRSGTSYFDDEG